MKYLIDLIGENEALCAAIFIADVLLAVMISKKMYLISSKRVKEALGASIWDSFLYENRSGFAAKFANVFEKYMEKGSLYKKARIKMNKAGYKGTYPVIFYLLARYIISPAFLAAGYLLNYPDLLRPLTSVVLINVVIELVIKAGKRKSNFMFQKHIYKVYKYLHNQISSGVKPTDAVRSVYEVVEDKGLKDVLIRLSARYELTLDIDTALEEFRMCFDAHEAETLCIALKQGIDTGDNSALLARQEDIMFKKYFNFIQTETDSCRNRSVAAAAVFVAIATVMIIVPMLGEASQAIGKIFIN